ncbi:hypothetical protein DERP_014303 [Dermatophagoides pteronyssinus]|uniref:Uncharacterized protein n=1 Tax=Dermatophagoides pteronyssinus TaxID=6956 RepID=A0ABQ8IXI4_DERPT|nr:hypothetical protein DERP_014303 [Dermatophagoides pteronyssinus]
MSDDNCKFFLKRTTNRSVRTRLTKTSSSNSSDSDSDEESSVIISDRKKRKPNPMIQSTLTMMMMMMNDAIHVSYASSKSGQRDGPSDMGATMTLETETERDKDAQSIFERSRKIQEETMDPNNDEQIYRGANNYQQYKQKKDTPFGNASSGHVRKGPMRAPDNIRSTVRWDYQPDICKDYKETGFCGFGDSCQKHKHGNEDDDNDDDPDKYKIDDDDDLPFACFICRNRFVNPVATKCKHYFCQQCALDHYKKSTKCFVCGAQTSGVFNIAKDIEKRMKTSEQFEQQKDEKDSEPDDQQDGQPSNDDDDYDNENI